MTESGTRRCRPRSSTMNILLKTILLKIILPRRCIQKNCLQRRLQFHSGLWKRAELCCQSCVAANPSRTARSPHTWEAAEPQALVIQVPGISNHLYDAELQEWGGVPGIFKEATVQFSSGVCQQRASLYWDSLQSGLPRSLRMNVWHGR